MSKRLNVNSSREREKQLAERQLPILFEAATRSAPGLDSVPTVPPSCPLHEVCSSEATEASVQVLVGEVSLAVMAGGSDAMDRALDALVVTRDQAVDGSAQAVVDDGGGESCLSAPSDPEIAVISGEDLRQFDGFVGKEEAEPATRAEPLVSGKPAPQSTACALAEDPSAFAGDLPVEPSRLEIGDGLTPENHDSDIHGQGEAFLIDRPDPGGAPVRSTNARLADEGTATSTMPLLVARTDSKRLLDGARDLRNKKKGRRPIQADLSIYTEVGEADRPWDLPREVYFRAVNDHEPVGDQQPLRKLWEIAELEGVNIATLDLTKENLSSLLLKRRLHDNPDRYASQILICLRRLLVLHPGLINKPVKPATTTRIDAVPHDEMPAAIRRDLEKWLQMTPVKMDGVPNPANTLRRRTIQNYADSTRTILAALVLAGIGLDPTVDIAFLAQRAAALRWLAELEKRCKLSTICGHLAALLRIAVDLPDQSQADIDFLATRLSKKMASLALDGDRLARLAKWTEPALHACLLAAPDTLMRVAEDTSRKMRLRRLVGASAFAFQLMWEFPALDEAAIATFNLATHIEGKPGARVVLRELPAKGGQPEVLLSQPMSADAERLLERLLATRQQMSVASTLLLPGNDGLPRTPRAAMEAIYNKIQGVLSERLVRTDFRDLNSSLVVENPNTDLEEAAAALGYAQARSLERRFAALIPGRSLGSGS